MPGNDKNFDELSEQFARNIYQQPKGKIRLEVLWWHLQKVFPELSAFPGMRILDAGCGMGHIAIRLAELGHEMTLCDISKLMLQHTEQVFQERDLKNSSTFIHSSLQALPDNLKRFDLIVCHAVVEWLDDPQQALSELFERLAPGGRLSLMFYNRNSLVMRNLIRGNLYKVASGEFSGEAGGLTPTQPLDSQLVYSWLEDLGMTIIARAGIRTFYDYMTRRDHISIEDIIEMEINLSEQEPHLSLGRYIHVVCRKPG